MAKVAKAKNGSSANPRSRAARRATSPSINTDKSLKETTRITESASVLGAMRNSGIMKKRKHKQMSRNQRERHERGLAKAEAIQDQLQTKIGDSKSRLKKRQSRKGLWEDINATSKDESRKAIKGPGRVGTGDEDSDWEDQQNIEPFHGDTEIKVIDGVQVPSFAAGTTMTVGIGRPVVTQPPQPPSAVKQEEEIT